MRQIIFHFCAYFVCTIAGVFFITMPMPPLALFFCITAGCFLFAAILSAFEKDNKDRITKLVQSLNDEIKRLEQQLENEELSKK